MYRKKKKIFLRIFSCFAILMIIIVLANWIYKLNFSQKFIYGVKFDQQRIERSIPILGKSAYTSSDWGRSWAYPTTKNAHHKWKIINVFKGELVSESDKYYLGEHYYDTNNRQVHISMDITYSYGDEKKGLNPWSAKYYSRDGIQIISLAEAEKILESWGINRLE